MSSKQILVDYCDTDIAKSLEVIIKSPYKKDFIKLLTPLICENENAVKNLMKIFTGYEFDEPIAIDTAAYIDINNLGWGVDKEQMKLQKLVKDDDTVLVQVTKHNGYHTPFDYIVSYISDISKDPDTGEKILNRKLSSVRKEHLIIFKEF